MAVFVDLAIPAVVIGLMVVVGLDLNLVDFRLVLTAPKPLVAGTLAPMVLFPLAAAAVVLSFDLPTHLAGGIILVAACPGGAISNFYTSLARADTVLSVSLTTVSCLAAFITLPLIARIGFRFCLGETVPVEIPVLTMMGQLFLLVLLPVSLGMAVRHRCPDHAARLGTPLRFLSVLAIIAVVVIILRDQTEQLTGWTATTVLFAALFTGLAMILGWGVARVTGIHRGGRFAFIMEFSCRNVAIAVVVAATLLGHAELLGFATVFFAVQVLFCLTAVMVFRLMARS